jgi:hypothetical protein
VILRRSAPRVNTNGDSRALKSAGPAGVGKKMPKRLSSVTGSASGRSLEFMICSFDLPTDSMNLATNLTAV